MTVQTIDCHYVGLPGFAAAFLMLEGDRAAFVETNTNFAVPRLLQALSDAGRKPEDVDYIIVTHVHLDHAGGASKLMAACPNAKLLAHPKAAPHLIDPSKLVASAKQVYGESTFEELYGDIAAIPESRVRIMNDEETLSFGDRTLRFLHTRGHANHHFCIHDSATNGVFTGDSFGILYPALQEGRRVVFPTTTPTDFDARAYQATIQRIVDTGCDRVFLTHFGEATAVREMAKDLHAQLDRYAALVDEADASGKPEAEVEAMCKAGVAQLFDELLEGHPKKDDPHTRKMLSVDIDLNGQGVAFAVKKARFKREQR